MNYNMQCTIEMIGSTMMVYLDGEIDHHTAKPLREQIDNEIIINPPKTLKIDFKDVSFMDSSGIGLIMGRYRLMKQYDGQVQISRLSPGIKKVMKLAGMDRLAKIEDC